MILLRHGETQFNVVFGATRADPGIPDPPLTEAGRSQAAAVAERLRGSGLTRLVVSPYRRALETGAIVADALGIPVAVEPAVRERSAYSCDVGTPASALKRAWARFAFDHLDEIWWSSTEEPETGFDRRCRAFATSMAALDDWPSVLVVTHWGVIRSLTGQRVRNGATVRFDPGAPSGAVVADASDPW